MSALVDQYGNRINAGGAGIFGTPEGGVLTVQGALQSYYAFENVGQPQSLMPVAALAFANTGGYYGGEVMIRTPAIFKTVAAVAVTAGTPVAIWTPAAGKTVRIMGWDLSLSVAGGLIFKQGTTPGGSIEVIRASNNGANVSNPSPPGMGNGVILSAVNNVLYVDVTASGTVSGFIFGTEE